MQNFKDTFETRKLSFIIFHFSIYMSVPLIIIIYRQIFERTNLNKKNRFEQNELQGTLHRT